MSKVKNVLIMGAAGRDFHNFNTYFRKNPSARVVAFTAYQIPGIAGRTYPPDLSGDLYPEGIPIFDESELPRLIKSLDVEDVVFSYSDVNHLDVMHKAALVNACGANFCMLGTAGTEIDSVKPVLSVCAVRTGCGKSQTSRRVTEILQAAGKKVASFTWRTALAFFFYRHKLFLFPHGKPDQAIINLPLAPSNQSFF